MVGNYYLPIELVSQCFIYKNGSLYWRERPLDHFADERAWKTWNTKYAGEEAGCSYFDENNNCRWVVGLSYKLIPRSVLVWALHYQEWPTSEIDHKDNTNTLNDRIENLRLATKNQQNANKRKQSRNTSGYKGVYWFRRDSRWQAKIGVNGRGIHLGYFNTREEAYAAYCQAAIKYFGEYACFE